MISLRCRREQEREQAWYFSKDLPRLFPYLRHYWRLALTSVAMIGLAILGFDGIRAATHGVVDERA